MLTARYHIASIMALFFALGIGIFIGGTLGQTWVRNTEDRVVDMLLDKYERQVAVNQELQKQIGSLQLIFREIDPVLKHKKILWIRPEDAKNELLSFIFQTVGAELAEQTLVMDKPAIEWKQDSMFVPDIILISSGEWHEQMMEELRKLQTETDSPSPVVVDVSAFAGSLHKPEGLADLMKYLKRLAEGDTSHAAANIGYSSGLE